MTLKIGQKYYKVSTRAYCTSRIGLSQVLYDEHFYLIKQTSYFSVLKCPRVLLNFVFLRYCIIVIQYITLIFILAQSPLDGSFKLCLNMQYSLKFCGTHWPYTMPHVCLKSLTIIISPFYQNFCFVWFYLLACFSVLLPTTN